MRGDFTRDTFHPDKHFSAVLLQQGRVLLDADFNEQATIQLRLARALAADVIGAHGGPGDGFAVTPVPADDDTDLPPSLTIAAGHYYVDGVLVDATQSAPQEAVGGPDPGDETPLWTYWDQPWAYLDPEHEDDELPDAPYVAYLTVWEDLVTAVEDPLIRESALGSALPDTAARSRVFWQVRAAGPDDGLNLSGVSTVEAARSRFTDWVTDRTAAASRLAARTERPDRTDEDPCIIAPESRYRGPENQLYRVEVHTGGTLGDRTGKRGPTFKWSRDNGSVTFPIVAIDGKWVTLAALGRDDKLDLHVGDAVEVADDAYAARLRPGRLLRVDDIDLPDRRVQLSDEPSARVGRTEARHPLLRRWDHPAEDTDDDGAVPIREGDWLDLEDGVQVWFKGGGTYRTGDFWLIPARTATGEVEWPRDPADRPVLRPPGGVSRHYAPLALVRPEADPLDLRHVFTPLA